MLPFLPALVVCPHQVFCVALAEVDGGLGTQILELGVFGPVLLGVQVPVSGEFRYLEHRERLLFLNFVINVQECSLESIVGHGVGDRLRHQAEVEGLVASAHLCVFKPNVDVAQVDAKVLLYHGH